MKRVVIVFGLISGVISSALMFLTLPLMNSAMTFIEPFPVGLVVTLVSAAILRRRTPAAGARVAQAIV